MADKNSLLSTIRNINISGRVALCGYFLSGYESPENFLNKVRIASNLDIVEFGIPTIDPFLDGTTISNAHKKVIDYLGIYTESALALIGALRDIPQPCFVMTYTKEGRELEGFLKKCFENNIQGIFVPDIDIQEAQNVNKIAKELGLAFLSFIDTNMVDTDIALKLDISDIVYLKASKGATGEYADTKGYLFQHLAETIVRIRNHKPEILIAVGIGIQDPDQIKNLVNLDINMVIIGTKIMEYMELGEKQLTEYIHDLHKATFLPHALIDL